MAELISSDKIENAYLEQKNNVANLLKNKSISGYKAAVSNKQAQKNVGLKTLISGVLFKEGELLNNCTISLDDFKLAKIETEIGFILNCDIDSLVTSESIKSKVSGLLPVFEIPDITADTPGNLTMLDIMSNNGFSSHYLVGEIKNSNEVNPNECVAKLFYNEEEVSVGKGDEAMDNQWEALAEAINLSIEHGYFPKKDNLIITGALGEILVLKRGVYTANYGKLGNLKLTVI